MALQDETNVPNMWQGALRFGALDLDLLAMTINEDEARAPIRVKKFLAMTCLDQLVAQAAWWQDDTMQTGAVDQLLEATRYHLRLPIAAISHGPCREEMVFSSDFAPDLVPMPSVTMGD